MPALLGDPGKATVDGDDARAAMSLEVRLVLKSNCCFLCLSCMTHSFISFEEAKFLEII